MNKAWIKSRRFIYGESYKNVAFVRYWTPCFIIFLRFLVSLCVHVHWKLARNYDTGCIKVIRRSQNLIIICFGLTGGGGSLVNVSARNSYLFVIGVFSWVSQVKYIAGIEIRDNQEGVDVTLTWTTGELVIFSSFIHLKYLFSPNFFKYDTRIK